MCCAAERGPCCWARRGPRMKPNSIAGHAGDLPSAAHFAGWVREGPHCHVAPRTCVICSLASCVRARSHARGVVRHLAHLLDRAVAVLVPEDARRALERRRVHAQLEGALRPLRASARRIEDGDPARASLGDRVVVELPGGEGAQRRYCAVQRRRGVDVGLLRERLDHGVAELLVLRLHVAWHRPRADEQQAIVQAVQVLAGRDPLDDGVCPRHAERSRHVRRPEGTYPLVTSHA